MKRRTILASLAFVVFAHSAAFAQSQNEDGSTPPAPGLTNPQAIAAFGGALMVCLQSRMAGQSITQLGDSAMIRLKPATQADRHWAPPRTPAEAPVWITDDLGSLLVVAEPSPERCELTAIQLSVDRTLQAVTYALQQARPDFTPVHVEAGYNPIVYQLESVVGGARYIVHVEGAEPGEPGHALRFSLIYGYVLRQPLGANDQESNAPSK